MKTSSNGSDNSGGVGNQAQTTNSGGGGFDAKNNCSATDDDCRITGVRSRGPKPLCVGRFQENSNSCSSSSSALPIRAHVKCSNSAAIEGKYCVGTRLSCFYLLCVQFFFLGGGWFLFFFGVFLGEVGINHVVVSVFQVFLGGVEGGVFFLWFCTNVLFFWYHVAMGGGVSLFFCVDDDDWLGKRGGLSLFFFCVCLECYFSQFKRQCPACGKDLGFFQKTSKPKTPSTILLRHLVYECEKQICSECRRSTFLSFCCFFLCFF